MSVRKTRNFQQMVLKTMELLIFCYSCKYTDWSINSTKWKTISSGALSSTRKWGQFLKTLSQKLLKLLFSMRMGMLWQVQKATGSWKYLSVDLQYLMFNAILKHNIKPTSCFQDTSSYRITGHARRFWVYWKKMSEYLYIYLIAWSHQTNYHSKQSSGQRNTKLWKLD